MDANYTDLRYLVGNKSLTTKDDFVELRAQITD